ncbi:MAG: FAA hydrolase family protein [Alphaproteobacteria bacterium]|nr:FAA hydrolase family protein [Alphaproteobacteria bacterium]
MRLVSYRASGRMEWGAVKDGGIVPLGGSDGRWPSLRAALAQGGLAEAGRAALAGTPRYRLDQVELLPPIPEPEKIICVGLNYAAHVKETGKASPEHPPLFVRYPSSLVGHGQSLVRPRISRAFDWEGELALVIGTGGRAIPAARALSHVAGYTCLMEGTLRDFQAHSSQFTAGKTFWRSGACGPWLVTADELPDPSRLTLETRVNGKVEQHSPVSDLVFDIPTLIAYISAITPLVPGDVISTGTPSGVGGFRSPPVYLKPGDTVEVELSGIGVLRNPVIDEQSPMAAP